MLQTSILYTVPVCYIPYIHEHNHTRILVPEVLCSLGGQETQNDMTTTTTVTTAAAASIVSPPQHFYL